MVRNLLFVAVASLSFLIFSAGGLAIDVSSCQNLSTTNGYYVLVSDVSAVGSCFNISANGITIDGNYTTITYGTGSVASNAINNTLGFNNITIKNVNIKKGNNSLGSSPAIRGNGMMNGTINNITIVMSESQAIKFSGSDSNNITNNNFTVYNLTVNDAVLDFDAACDYNIIENNTVTNTASGYTTELYQGTGNLFLNNTLRNTGYQEVLRISLGASYNNVTNNTIINEGSDYGLQFLTGATRNIVSGNYFNASSDYSIKIYPGSSDATHNQTIDSTNTERGNPIYYYFSNDSLVIEDLANVGQLIVSVSENVTIRNVSVVGDGITFSKVNDSTITNTSIIISKTDIKGVYFLSASNRNNISYNTILSTGYQGEGFYFVGDLNNITNNNITTTGQYADAIFVSTTSGYNSIKNNTLITEASSAHGIYLLRGYGGIISYNNITTAGSFSYGLYMYLYADNNTISGNNITSSSSSGGGLQLQEADNNTLENNIVSCLGCSGEGIYIYDSSLNNITGGSVTASSANDEDYYLRGAGTSNNFTNTQFVGQNRIYFYDVMSWFNYNNQTTGNIWLKTNSSAATSFIDRLLLSWSNNVMQWNDTGSITMGYNITGLQANTVYNIVNQSESGVQTAQVATTDSKGDLPAFTILLSGQTNIGVTANTQPKWDVNATGVPSSYSSTPSYFNITWTDDAQVSTVFFESNFSGSDENYTMTALGSGVYSYNETLPAGTFYWRSYANDSANTWNITDTWGFSISQSSGLTTFMNISVNGTDADVSYKYENTTNATGYATIAGQSGLNFTFYRDGSAYLGSSSSTPYDVPDVNVLGVAAPHTYIYNTTGNTNYSAATVTRQLTISQKTPQLNLYINESTSPQISTYPAQPTTEANSTALPQSGFSIGLYVDGNLQLGSDSTYPYSITDTTVLGGSANHTYQVNTSGNANYTPANVVNYLYVNPGSLPLTLLLNDTEGDKTYNEPATSPAVIANFTGTANWAGVPDGAGLQLWTNYSSGTNNLWDSGASPLINISQLSGLGKYNWTLVFPGGANYSANSTTHHATISDATNPTVYLGSPGNYTGGSAGQSGTSTSPNVSLHYIPSDIHIGSCYLYSNFTGTWMQNTTNATPVTNSADNWFNVTVGDGTYIWNVNCSDTSSNSAFNATNYTLKVDSTAPQILSVWTNDTDNFYSNCTGNNNVTLVLEAGESGLNITANFSLLEEGTQPSEIQTDIADLGGGLYRAVYNMTSTDYNFSARLITTITTDGFYSLVNYTNATEIPIVYNMTTPASSELGGDTTNFCTVMNFSGISGLTFEEVNYGMVVFTQEVNLSTLEQAQQLSGLADVLNVINSSIYINTTYFSELNLSANVSLYFLPWTTEPNLTYTPEGGTSQACPPTICGNTTWTNTTTYGNLSFQVSGFSNYTADGNAPVILTSGPSGTQSSSSVTLTATTDETATCKYDTSDVAYTNMSNTFSTTGSTSHSQSLSLSNGAYNYYVRCIDMANNTMTSSTTISFSVSVSTTNTGGGGGGAAAPAEPTETQIMTSVQEGNSATITLTNTRLTMTSIEIIAAELILNAQITVTQSSGMPSSVTVSAGDNTYKYLIISKSGMTDTAVKNAKIRFKVTKSWLTDKGYSASQIVLSRYSDGIWTDLPTKQTNEDPTYYYFEAESPMLSVYAVKAVTVTAPAPEETPTEETPAGETPTEETPTGEEAAPEETPPLDTGIVAAVIIAIIAIGAGAFYLSEQKKKPWQRKKLKLPKRKFKRPKKK